MFLSLIASGLWGTPSTSSVSTLVAVGVLFLGCSAVTFMTWRSAQGTGSIGQLLHETEVSTADASTRRAASRLEPR